MKAETGEWVSKAEGNWRVAGREIQTGNPVYDIVCFLAQQCTEQYLKAFLEEHGIAFRKTHDLVVLYNSSAGLLTELDTSQAELAYLGTLGIAARYPGTEATQPDAEDAMRIAQEVRATVRLKLGIS
ncbi:MAG TPA: HEPN domain-containing protein [Chloroflexia bacterium]|jgi:HEPN domain-containing protein